MSIKQVHISSYLHFIMKKESYKQENQTFLMFLTCYGKRKKNSNCTVETG